MTLEIPVELIQQAERFGLDPQFVARRILQKAARIISNAESIIIAPEQPKAAEPNGLGRQAREFPNAK